MNKYGWSDRQVLINLVASLTLADHMGDAMDDAYQALKLIDIDLPYFDEDGELMGWLRDNHSARGIWDSSLVD